MSEAEILAKYLTGEQLEDLLSGWILELNTEEDEHIKTIKEAIKILTGEE